MKLFLFILDGCAASQLIDANTPFLDRSAQDGRSSVECEAVFPSATYTGHSSIITGNYPEKHGMVGNQFWDRKSTCVRNFDFFDPNEHIESPTIFEILPFTTCAIAEPVTRGASIIGEKRIFDQMTLTSQNRAIFHYVMKSISPDIQFYMVNFQGVDGYGETMGPESREYLRCLEEVDEYLSKIAEHLHSDFIFIITADHGMVQVEENINLEEELKNDGFITKCLASHRCNHIYLDSYVGKLENHLQRLPYIDKIYNTEGLKKIHLQHRRTGDLAVSAKKGYEFGEEKLKGSHGGATEDELLVPFIFYDSSGKFTDRISLEPIRLVDICPTIIEIFGIKTPTQFQGESLCRR
ncbi:MAG: alkaline phosphatase family protein [Candidatus Helarchaeota archaeon]